MIISYENHDVINDINDELMMICTSNRHVYLELLNGFRGRNELVKIFNEKFESLLKSKYIDFYGDLINFEGLSSKVITSLINNIFDGLINDEINDLQHHSVEIQKIIQSKLFMLDVPLITDIEIPIKDILKNAKIHLDDAVCDNPYDIINLLIRLKIENGDKSMIIVCNLANYLNDDQLTEIHNMCKEVGLSIIDIEYEKESINRSSICRYYFIDEDFVDWQY